MELLLARIAQIISIDEKEKAWISSMFKERNLKKGDYFLSEGKICKEVGFINQGIVRYYINHNGEEKNYGFGREGDFVSNYESFIPETPSGQSIQALEDCSLMTLTKSGLEEFYKKIKQGERFGRKAIEMVFIQAIKDIKSLYTDPPETRYLHFLSEFPELQQRLPQYHIASYVGVKPQSLSRIRKRRSRTD